MSNNATPPVAVSDPARAFTKRLRWAAEMQMLAILAAIFAYAFLGLHYHAAHFAQTLTHSLPIQVALCWFPLWLACTTAAFPIACYSFRVQRKFGLLTGSAAGGFATISKQM